MGAGIESNRAEGSWPLRSAEPGDVLEVVDGTLTTMLVSLSRQPGAQAVLRKRLREEYVEDAELRETLLSTMEAVGHLGMRLRVPQIVRTLAVTGAVAGGSNPFLVLEHVRGATLHQLLSASHGSESTRYVVRILLDVLAGLSAMHELRGPDGAATPYIHQAPSARHILVGLDGKARLIDLMHAAGPGLPASSLRQRFLRPDEMSPEQASGTGHIDARCDVFIVGIVLWEALTGERLFAAPSAAEAQAKVLRMPISAPSLHGTSSFFDGVCTRALMRVRVGRYNSAAEMAEALRDVAQARGLCAEHDEVAAWVAATLGRSNRESRTFIRSRSSEPPAAPVAKVEAAAKVSRKPSLPPVSRALAMPRRGAEPKVAPGVAPTTYFDETRPTQSLPALAEQLAADMVRDPDAPSHLDEPVHHVEDAELVEASVVGSRASFLSASQLRHSQAPAAPVDSGAPSETLSVSLFQVPAVHVEPELNEPTLPRVVDDTLPPRVISAVFGGPVPSVLSDAPAWAEELVEGGPEPSLESLSPAISSHGPRSGWLSGALAGAAAVAMAFGAYLWLSKPPTAAPDAGLEASRAHVASPAALVPDAPAAAPFAGTGVAAAPLEMPPQDAVEPRVSAQAVAPRQPTLAEDTSPEGEGVESAAAAGEAERPAAVPLPSAPVQAVAAAVRAPLPVLGPSAVAQRPTPARRTQGGVPENPY
jgi:serine/threonine-protein kinase